MASRLFRHPGLARPRFRLAGWICIVLIAGAAMPLVTALIGSYISAIGKAGALARYGVVSMVVNIALTVPMVLLGSLGVVAATAIGQLVAAVYMLHDVRRTVRSDLPNPLRYVPLLRGAAAAALTLGLEVAHPALPAHRRARVACGRRPGTCRPGVFAVLVLGPRRALRIVARPRSAAWELRHWAALSEEPLAQADASTEYEPKHSQAASCRYPRCRRLDGRCERR